MQPQELILVSVDGNLVEPSPLLEGTLPTEGAVSLGSLSAKLNV